MKELGTPWYSILPAVAKFDDRGVRPRAAKSKPVIPSYFELAYPLPPPPIPMSKIPFYIVDVFTSTPFGGNQLAVVLDSNASLTTTQMQSVSFVFFIDVSFYLSDCS